MKHPDNLKRLAPGFIDDEVGQNPVEKNLPACEIGAAMADVWNVSQLVETFEEFSDHPVRRLHTLLLQEVKPDGVDIEDGIIG